MEQSVAQLVVVNGEPTVGQWLEWLIDIFVFNVYDLLKFVN
jgi:hypothetical protein